MQRGKVASPDNKVVKSLEICIACFWDAIRDICIHFKIIDPPGPSQSPAECGV